jgi:hypothetical protein
MEINNIWQLKTMEVLSIVILPLIVLEYKNNPQRRDNLNQTGVTILLELSSSTKIKRVK